MLQHAYYLRYFYFHHNLNHTIGDLFGVIFFLKFFDSSRILKKWKKKLVRIFRKQIFLQLRKDGVNIEQSVNYHRIVISFFIFFAIVYPNTISGKELSNIEKGLKYLYYIRKPNGKLPNVGDSDNGKVVPLNTYKKEHYL